jgi:nucleoside-triphosphatase THEP1
MICLLTGQVGVGKTTVAERVAGLARRTGLVCGGILAPALKKPCGQKAGIWGIDLATGERRLLARTDRELGGPSVGVYSFDAEGLDWAVETIERAIQTSDLVFVDEIGKLELWRGEGLAPVLPLLASGGIDRALVLVREELLLALQERLVDVETVVVEVTEANRDGMPGHVLDTLWAEARV